MLSKIYEANGDITAACEIIQDVHVETYGSLSKNEKAEYILEQIRINLLKKDYIRALIHSRKVNLKTIEEQGFASVKIRFFSMMVEYHTVAKEPWEVCQAYFKIAETVVSDLNQLRKESLESCVIYLLLSKHDNQQHDMLHRLKKQLISEFKDLQLDAAYTEALLSFTTDEIVPVPFPQQALFEKHACLHKYAHLQAEIGSHFVALLKDRTVQHNLRVVAKYYKRIRTARLGALLGLTTESIEAYLSELSSNGELFLKIDRPAGIVSFTQKRSPEEVLSDWSSDIGKVLGLMEDTFHLINRELVVHQKKLKN
jgi:26S proteasome regulatory subunit N5